MTLWHWLGGAIGVGAVTIAGGNIYADQQLKNFYYSQPQNIEGLIDIQVKDYNVGVLNGHAEYLLTLQLDACQPDTKYEFKVKDTIRKNLMGYRIDSDIELPQEWQAKVQKYFAEQSPLAIQTNISWLGNVHTQLLSPAINYQKDDVYIQSKGITFSFDSNKKDTNHLENVMLDIPSFIVRDDKNYFSIDEMKVNTDQYHSKKILPNTNSVLTINNIRMQTHLGQSFGLNMDQFKAENHTKVIGNKINSLNSVEVSKMNRLDTEQQGKLRFNLDINDLDKVAMQAFIDEMYLSNKACIQGEARKKTEDKAVLALFAQGFKFESKDNLFELGSDAQFKVNFSGELSKSNYDSVESFIKHVPKGFKITGEMETSKSFVKQIMNLNKNSAEMADDQILDMLIQQMKSEGKLKVDGNKLMSKFEYKYGMPRFLP